MALSDNLSRYAELKIRNKTRLPVQINYSNGDSIQIPSGRRVVSIPTANLGQIPSANEIELVSPTIFELSAD